MSSHLEKLFANNGLRNTKPRLSVFSALQEADSPLQIAEIAKRCPEVDRVSVYRTIELFLTLHIVDRVMHGWKPRYELASPFKPHHHHLSCTNCSRIIELHSEELERLVARTAQGVGFAPERHTFEITGLCRQCQAIHRATEQSPPQ